MEIERITAEDVQAFADAIKKSKVFSGGNHTPPEDVLNQYRRAYCDDIPTQVTTLTGTPTPQRIPYRLENIEEAQIETA